MLSELNGLNIIDIMCIHIDKPFGCNPVLAIQFLCVDDCSRLWYRAASTTISGVTQKMTMTQVRASSLKTTPN